MKKHPAGVYFTNLDAFRKALTQKRLELLHAIRLEKPASIQQLARLVHRDIKNVSTDIKYLYPIVDYEKKELDIAV